MRQIIEGMIYDTNNAQELRRQKSYRVVSYKGPVSGESHLIETIYRTEQGKWFLKREQNRLFWLEWHEPDLLPLTEDEAYQWLCEFNEIDLLQKYFPDRVSKA
jgi:hypothetical protein